MFKWRLIITWSSRPRERWYLMVIHLEGLHFEKENDSLDWNVYSVSNLCWWYDRRRIVNRKTLKELLFSGKPSRDGGEENNDLLKIWKCQEEEEGQSEKTKSFRAISFVVSLFGIACCCWSEPESWFLLSDLHEPEWSKSSDRSLGWFKSTRVQRPELFRLAWMGFKWVALNCSVFLYRQ